MTSTMIAESPAHKEYKREQAEAHIKDAISKVEDGGVFSDDQIVALREVIWDIYHAITRTI